MADAGLPERNKRRPAIPAAFFLAGLTFCALAHGAEPYAPPRLSNGHPDLQGFWNNSSLTTLERSVGYGDHLVLGEDETAALEEQFTDFEDAPGGGETATFSLGGGGDYDAYVKIMRVAGQPRSSLITDPKDGRVPPAKPGAVTYAPPSLTEAQMASDPETQPVAVRCLPNMSPNAGPVMLPGPYNNNFEIVQGDEAVAIVIQMAGDLRIVRMGGKHRTDGLRLWMGDSIGHWDKDSLVVETTNFRKDQAFYGAWEHLKVTERFTRVAKDRLLYQFTVDDPTIWGKPWGGEYEFAARDTPYDEYACHENDPTIQYSLEAARYEDAHPK